MEKPEFKLVSQENGILRVDVRLGWRGPEYMGVAAFIDPEKDEPIFEAIPHGGHRLTVVNVLTLFEEFNEWRMGKGLEPIKPEG